MEVLIQITDKGFEGLQCNFLFTRAIKCRVMREPTTEQR